MEFSIDRLQKSPMLQDQPERAVRTLAKMKNLNVLPDIRTYELMFSLFGNVNAPYEDRNVLSWAVAAKRITCIEKGMRRHGIQHSPRSMQNLVGSSSLQQILCIYLKLGCK